MIPAAIGLASSALLAAYFVLHFAVGATNWYLVFAVFYVGAFVFWLMMLYRERRRYYRRAMEALAGDDDYDIIMVKTAAHGLRPGKLYRIPSGKLYRRIK